MDEYQVDECVARAVHEFGVGAGAQQLLHTCQSKRNEKERTPAQRHVPQGQRRRLEGHQRMKEPYKNTAQSLKDGRKPASQPRSQTPRASNGRTRHVSGLDGVADLLVEVAFQIVLHAASTAAIKITTDRFG